MNLQANQHVTPFEQFAENAEDQLWASIISARQAQEPIQQTAQVMPQQNQTQPVVNNQVAEQQQVYQPTVAEPVVQESSIDSWQLWWSAINEPISKPIKTDDDFDNALKELEDELWITYWDTKEITDIKEDTGTNKDTSINKGLEREKNFLNIINDLDSANKKSLTRAWELEVKLTTAEQQMEYFKQQAHDYYEELRSNEFDRNRFEVAQDAKNFVHYFNEYSWDKENVQAKDSALREAIKIVNKITGRDLTNYLQDYFTMWTANLWELPWWSWLPQANFVKTPWGNWNPDSSKRNILWTALSNM